MSEKHELFELAPYHTYIGLGKKPTSGEKEYHQNMHLHSLQKIKKHR